MPLTMGHHVFAGLHEDAMNKFMTAFRAARPRYFWYACPPLGAGSPGTDFYVIPPLPIPGTAAGMPISVRIVDVLIDLVPGQSSLHLPQPLSLGPNQFALLTNLEVCFMCGALQPVADPPQGGKGKEDHGNRQPYSGDGKSSKDCTKLTVWAIGHPISSASPNGGRDVSLRIDRIVVKDVAALESLIECYTQTMLNALLDTIKFTIARFALGAFGSLGLSLGPQIASNQLQVWADIN
jgi:hypothetical protein